MENNDNKKIFFKVMRLMAGFLILFLIISGINIAFTFKSLEKVSDVHQKVEFITTEKRSLSLEVIELINLLTIMSDECFESDKLAIENMNLIKEQIKERIDSLNVDN